MSLSFEQWVDHILDQININPDGIDITISDKVMRQDLETHLLFYDIPVQHVSEDCVSVASTWGQLDNFERRR